MISVTPSTFIGGLPIDRLGSTPSRGTRLTYPLRMAEGPVVLVTFGAALLAIAGTVMALSIAFVGIGVSIRRGFGLRLLSLDDCLLSFWVGYSLTLLWLILWNFALPVERRRVARRARRRRARRDPRTLRPGGGARRQPVETASLGMARPRRRQSLGGEPRHAAVRQLGWRARITSRP